MKLSSAAIIPSGNSERIKECLQHLAKQTVPFDRIIVAAWGQNAQRKQQVLRAAISTIENVEIVESENDRRPETNLNNGISYLSGRPTNRVTFLNDDTLLDKKWHESMQQAAIHDGDKVAHATVVMFKSKPNLIQSAGHILGNAKPREFEYKKITLETSKDKRPLCPCGNSAFVPWSAIEQIRKMDPHVWDPNFIRWQSCFDFGLKLQLCGYDCHIVPSARAIHEGYLDKSLKGEKLKKKDVKDQLRSRLLLYDKFFPNSERKKAMKILEKSVRRWSQKGYPHAENVNGDLIKCLLERAQIESKDLLENTSHLWIGLVNRLDVQARRRLLFGNIRGTALTGAFNPAQS